ncbi:hypothetical protein ACFX2C_006372 [Malus domestica]
MLVLAEWGIAQGGRHKGNNERRQRVPQVSGKGVSSPPTSQQEISVSAKKWHRLQEKRLGPFPNPAQWFTENIGLIGQNRLIPGLDRTTFGKGPSIVIEEILETNVSQLEGGTLAGIHRGKELDQRGDDHSRRNKRVMNDNTLKSAQVPQKRCKLMIEDRNVIERKGRTAEDIGRMTIKERCSMMMRALDAEEELQEVLIEYQDMWDYMENVSAKEKEALLAKKKEKSSRVSGGWPSTAARSP